MTHEERLVLLTSCLIGKRLSQARLTAEAWGYSLVAPGQVCTRDVRSDRLHVDVRRLDGVDEPVVKKVTDIR